MKTVDKNTLKRVLVTDCGSTTTKALLFQKKSDRWHQTHRGEAPTTVEEPVADVTVGAVNAFREVQDLSNLVFLNEGSEALLPFGQHDQGIDAYLSTSSAGGGLQMIVGGVVRQMTTESAERAALGAGAIVLDALSVDDRREDHERIERIRHLRPDIILLTGGVDGGAVNHVVEMAEMIVAANPRPRFGDTLKLPVIYAGNKDAAEEVEEILQKIATVSAVGNIRPQLEVENLGPAREAIHEYFLSHVMSHSPGYGKLMSWASIPIMPTPSAVGDIVQQFAESKNQNVLAVDIGGATTDVFSVFRNDSGSPVFNRTVSANLGMSYSVANVLIEAGSQSIARWLPYKLSSHEIHDRLRNKMIRPTSIPQTSEDLWLEQAVCREALRLSLDHHRSLAVGLSGVKQQRGIADIFAQKESRYQLVDMMKLDVVIGSGGVLSHAPDRLGAALMMIDGFGLEGITEICVDSIFMMPHLGVFSSVHPEGATEIFQNDCLVRIAHVIAPVYSGKKRNLPESLAMVFVNGSKIGEIQAGKIQHLPDYVSQRVQLRVEPVNKHIDVGNGKGQPVEKEIFVGEAGFILDGRGRPIQYSENSEERVQHNREIYQELELL